MDFTLSASRPKVDLSQVFDVAVLGAGPAGLTAAIYCGRYRLNTLVIEKKFVCGGQLATINSLQNYPGFQQPVSGSYLAKEMESQAISMGGQILQAEVGSVNLSNEIKKLTTSKGVISARAVIISTGAQPRMLNIPGEQEYLSQGISYCATCDGHLYINKTIAVVGGGNTALEEAIALTRYASKIYLIHRREEFRADKIIQEQAQAAPKIEFILNATVQKIDFSDEHKKSILINVKGQQKILAVEGVFIFAGRLPNSSLLGNALNLEEGFIVTDPEMKASIAGVFAAGDIRRKSLRQIATAVGEGAIAAFSANKYLSAAKSI